MKRFKFLFAWYDLWVGFFWDKKKKWLYIFPIPMLGLIVKFKIEEGEKGNESGHPFPVGSIGVIIKEGSHEFKVGEKVKISKVYKDHYECRSDEDSWWVNFDQIKVEEGEKEG